MSTPLRILPLGDSITNALPGYNSYRRDLWNLLGENGYDVDFIGSRSTASGNIPFPDSTFDPDHEGRSGWRTDEILNGRNGGSTLADWLTGYTPDVALVHLGTNDALQRNSPESSAEELKQVIDLLRQDNPNVVIFLAQVIPTSRSLGANNSLNALNAEIPGIVAEKNTADSPVILVDHNTGFDATIDTYDELHPNESGEAKMAQKWFEAIDGYFAGLITDPEPEPNGPPRANRDLVTLVENTSITVDVLANDRDPDGDDLSLVSLIPGQNGTAEIVDGEVTYTPNADFVGKDVVRYLVSDSKGATSTGYLRITVESDGLSPEPPAINGAPRANRDLVTLVENTSVTVDVLANDRDPDGDDLSLVSLIPGQNGTAEIVDGEVIYTPNADFVGKDVVRYVVSDSKEATSTGYVRITVESDGLSPEPPAVNGAPRANRDLVTLEKNTSVTVDVLANDRDPDGDDLSLVSLIAGQNGTSEIVDGEVIYTPDADFVGKDVVRYLVSDTKEATSTGYLRITVADTINQAASVSLQDDTRNMSRQEEDVLSSETLLTAQTVQLGSLDPMGVLPQPFGVGEAEQSFLVNTDLT
ncbi:MAG: Ig-like domain-containing protein [Cyanobacteria bacterium J06606_4]